MVRLNEIVYGGPIAILAAVACFAAGVAVAVLAVVQAEPAGWGAVVVLWLYGALLLWATKSTRERSRLRALASKPDPIPEGVLDLYYSSDKELASIAVQRGVFPGPVRREQTRRWGFKGGAGKGVQLSGERGGERTEVYDLPSDMSQLLRELTKKLRDAGELDTELAGIPSVDVDVAFDQSALEVVLREGYERRRVGLLNDDADRPIVDTDTQAARIAAEIITEDLPQANLAAAKKTQFANAQPG